MAILELDGYGVHYGARPIIQDIDLTLQPGEVFVLMGPGGSGKSTLVRTLCGLNDVSLALSTQGQARYRGRALSSDSRPSLIPQRLFWTQETTREVLCDALPDRASLTLWQQDNLLEERLQTLELREIFERRHQPWWNLRPWHVRALGLVCASLRDQPLLCVDEPWSSLHDEGRASLMALMMRMRDAHTWLLITHHQTHARHFGDRVALLAGGTFQEVAPVDAFFDTPRSAAARDFVRTGGCHIPRKEEDLEDAPRAAPPNASPPPEPSPQGGLSRLALDRQTLESLYPLPRAFARASVGPRGFHWLIPGLLGGTPLPGWLHDLPLDIAALRRTGAREIITLTEDPLTHAEGLGLTLHHFPIQDMEAPDLEETISMCRRVDDSILEGRSTIYHCKAGLGRTGTMLVAQLIFKGMTAPDALGLARRIEKRWVQSPAQEAFLHQLQDALFAPTPHL